MQNPTPLNIMIYGVLKFAQKKTFPLNTYENEQMKKCRAIFF